MHRDVARARRDLPSALIFWATLPLLPHAIGVAVKRDTDASNKGATSEAGDDFESSTGLAGKRSKKRRPR